MATRNATMPGWCIRRANMTTCEHDETMAMREGTSHGESTG